MSCTPEARFLRIPNALFEELLRARLNGAQWRVLLWVIRYTHGWNRASTAFTWYQLAKDLGLDRATTYRAGQALLHAKVLVLGDDKLGLQNDPAMWAGHILGAVAGDAKQLWLAGIDVVKKQRKPLSGNNATVVNQQRNRCQETSLFRRAKDRCKDNLKTYIKTGAASDVTRQPFRNGAVNEHPHQAGAARPIPGKYDRFS